MNHSLIAAILVALCFHGSLYGEERKLVFEDNFDRNESQEETEEIGNGWASNSKARAGGHKQVDLKDGAMYIYLHQTADHAVSVTHPAEFRNGSVELRFMLEHEDDSLGLNFADLQFKEVWAGHLFVAKISTKDVQLQDLKTGNMDLKIRELRQANQLNPELQEKLKSKTKKVSHKLQVGKWYLLRVTIQDDTLSVEIDGNEVASFSSAGIAHPTKRTLRLAVPRNAVVDDVKVFSR
jgi:hypothetical protein